MSQLPLSYWRSLTGNMESWSLPDGLDLQQVSTCTCNNFKIILGIFYKWNFITFSWHVASVHFWYKCSKSVMVKYALLNICRHLLFHISISVIMFCNAAVIFPTGFNMDHIGGEPYQLPSSYQVGISYIFFVLALWITVISELFAGKVCLPHFWWICDNVTTWHFVCFEIFF